MKTVLHASRERGLTMMELLITMSIVAILSAIAIPSFKYVTQSNRSSSEVNALLGDMRYARTEAVKEGLPVTVCSSKNGTSCLNSIDWSQGWIVFSDTNGDHIRNGNEPLLRVQSALGTTFGGTDSFQAAPALLYVTFNREGFAATGLTTTNIALHDSTNTSAYTRCVVVTSLGVISTTKYGSGTPACS